LKGKYALFSNLDKNTTDKTPLDANYLDKALILEAGDKLIVTALMDHVKAHPEVLRQHTKEKENRIDIVFATRESF
jgi:hypothetical protein